MRKTALLAFVITTALVTSALAAESPQELVGKAEKAWGGHEAFAKLGVLKLTVDEKEVMADGTEKTNAYIAYLDTSLANSRIEWKGGMDLVTVRNGQSGWATKDGVPDRRQQTPRMVPGTNHMKLFAIVLPFSLQMDGVELGKKVVESDFWGVPAYQMSISMRPMFFATPVINHSWELFFARDDHRFLGAGYLPVEKYQQANDEGMQYRVLETTTVSGITVPTKLQVTGVDKLGRPTQHSRKVEIDVELLRDPSPALFIRPDKLAEMEEDA